MYTETIERITLVVLFDLHMVQPLVILLMVVIGGS